MDRVYRRPVYVGGPTVRIREFICNIDGYYPADYAQKVLKQTDTTGQEIQLDGGCNGKKES